MLKTRGSSTINFATINFAALVSETALFIFVYFVMIVKCFQVQR